ncbi:MAG: DpnD/PcfM family protein [Clostridia bacterium]|nr:DpnD/PcfM family protein [Clostridia bacterium]
MKRYQVVVTEYLRQTVEIEAESEEQACEQTMTAWLDGAIYLDAKDYDGGDVCVIGEHPCREGDEVCDYTYH